MKKKVRTLRIHRETLICLDRARLERVDGGVTTDCTYTRCTYCCTFGSCGHICP
jgi:hypothetical protein